MMNACQIRRTGLPVFLVLIAAVPLLLGQGCPPLNKIGQVADPNTGGNAGNNGNDSGQNIPGGTTNTPPFFEFTKPVTDVTRDVGQTVLITWRDSDPDDNAVITLMLVPNQNVGLTNPIIIEANIKEDPDGVEGDSYLLNTGAKNIQAGDYRIVASIADGVNPPEQFVAPGLLHLFPPGLVPGNLPPTVVVTEPMQNLAVGHGGQVPISWCVSDPDDGEDNVLPDIVILLDLDNNPNNDLDLTGLDAEQSITNICFAVQDPTKGPYPIVVNGQTQAFVIGCVKDKIGGQIGECSGPNAVTTPFPPNGTYTIDAMKIQPRVNGAPYRVRVTAWDHTNRAVSSYAFGSVSVTAMATGNSGVVDLASVGGNIRGTKFVGFDAGGETGYTGVGVGDMDGDGVDDFVIVSRYGRGFGLEKTGTVHLVFGMAGQEFGTQVPLNSITTTYRGALFTLYNSIYDTWDWMGSGPPPRNDGIVSVTRVDDLTGDGRPEFLIGMPFVERLWDYEEDDPCHKDGVCYGDGWPNPLSTGDAPRDMEISDWREGWITPQPPPDPPPPPYLCSNDMDLTVQTPIMGGYGILVGSNNALSNQIFALEEMGEGGANGARFRGAYLDILPWFFPSDPKPTYPYIIQPDNGFGTTVASMPEITDAGPGRTARHGVRPVISMPMADKGRGAIWNLAAADYTSAAPGIQSYPFFLCIGGAGRSIFLPSPNYVAPLLITGEQLGDMLGYGAPAGDLNLDGLQDLACGAPGASRDGLTGNGIVYVLYGRPDLTTPNGSWDVFEWDMQFWSHQRLEIHGTHNNDRFGLTQTTIGDINQDGVPDLAFASQYAGSDGVGGAESGFIGIVFGGVQLSGLNRFTVDQVGGPTLPGVRIYGRQAGGHAGAVLNDAGDFNGDGVDDLLIVAPDEIRTINGLRRKGVAYLVFGGPHLSGKTINLSQVGSLTVPGLVFVTPYVMGTADEAPIQWAGPAGDVNGDGFADILIGVPDADKVYPLNPSQREIDAGEMYLIYGSNSGNNSVGG